MFDKIKLVANAKDNDLNTIVELNNLIEVERKGKSNKTTYDNLGILKNTVGGGMYIKVDTKAETITIEGSLHKYYMYQVVKKLDNYSMNLSISEALAAFDMLNENTGIDIYNAKLKHLETAVNLYVKHSPTAYMEKMISLTNKRGLQLFLVENPKYKEKSELVTNMHRAKRKYYKVYDKVLELIDNRKIDIKEIPEQSILRLETVWKRIDRLTLKEFLHSVFLTEHINEFIKIWNSMLFEKQLIVPKGTKENRRFIIKDLLKHNKPDTVVEMYRKQYKNKELTEKQFRTKREFIQNEWHKIKDAVFEKPHPEELDYFKKLKTEISDITSN